MKKLLAMVLLLSLLCTGVASASVLGTYPVSDEVVNLTGWGILAEFATIDNFSENGAMQELERITGVHVDWECVTQDGCAEKRALRLAQGDLPDIFFRAALTNEEVASLASAGQLVDLAPLLEQYAPNFSALMEQDPTIRLSIEDADGAIYALPQVTTYVLTTHPIINTTWLENVGLEMPTTIDEYYNALVAFKEQDANGNGDPDDEIPLSATGLARLYDLMAAFGVYPRNEYGMFVYPGTSEMQCSYIADGMKDALIFFNKLYTEGLLDAETFAQDNDMLTAKGTANRLGSLVVDGAFVNVGNELHWDYAGMAAFPDANGNAYTNQRSSCSGNQFAITANCENPEAALAYVDYLYSEDGTTLAWLGVEGETWEWIDDEKTTWDWILPSEDTSINELRHNETIQGGTGYPSAHPVWFESDMWAHQADEIEGSLDTERFRMPLTDCGVLLLPSFKWTVEESETISFILPDCSTYFTSCAVDFITGVSDIEAEWDEYVDTMKSMGIEEGIAIYQEAYDNYMAKLNG